MEMELILEAIQDFVGLPDDLYDLEDLIKKKSDQAELRLSILECVYNFIHLFQMFKNIKPLMRSVYKCVQKTLDHDLEEVNDYSELLLRNTLFRLLQELLAYKALHQKDMILQYLLESLEKLQLQPMIINLGLMVKPIYQDINYVKKIESLEAVEISYILGNEQEIDLKEQIDTWISQQTLDLDKTDEIKQQLIEKYDEIIDEYKIAKGTKDYKRILNEIVEMLNLKLTVMSLMNSVADDIQPIPIK